MNRKEDIILVGGGGHCKACIDVIEQESRYKIKGIIDTPEKTGQVILGYPVIGSDDNIKVILKDTKNALITIGQIKSPELRIKLFNQVKNAGGVLPVIVSSKAYVSKHTNIGEGTIVMHGAVINSGVTIGKNCIINSLSLVEHDSVIGDNVHISTGARINGNCIIGKNCFIGSGTVINQGIKLCENILIASGSLVRKDVSKSGVYAGNPLRKVK